MVVSQLHLPDVPDEGEGDELGLTPMQRVMTIAARVAPLDSTVLILGESGVGKERLARWLHEASPRKHRPFVGVNCGAFVDTLLESELFGHARGAFTGAVIERAGVFEAAHGGSLFLDEIGEVSRAMQVRLLRVLQEREVRRLGETRARPIDVRIIAATNRDLLEEVNADRFRVDLYYRLQVVELPIPPLRDRPGELRTLARELLPRTAKRLGRQIQSYTADAWGALMRHPWPGNIRELEHAIERACAIAKGSEVDLVDLPAAVRESVDAPRPKPFRHQEAEMIRAVVKRHAGDRVRAAEELGISMSTLRRRLRRTV